MFIAVLVSSGLPGEAGFLSGVALRSAIPSFQKVLSKQVDVFTGAPGGLSTFPAGEPDGGRLSLLADIPFTRLSAVPFLSGFTGRQGLTSAVAFLD